MLRMQEPLVCTETDPGRPFKCTLSRDGIVRAHSPGTLLSVRESADSRIGVMFLLSFACIHPQISRILVNVSRLNARARGLGGDRGDRGGAE